MPIYLETREGRLLQAKVPYSGLANTTEGESGDFEVSIGISPARLFLRHGAPGRDEMLRILSEAIQANQAVLVTANDGDEIIHVQKDESGRIIAVPFDLELAPPELDLTKKPVLKPQDAQAIFFRMAGLSCDPRTPNATCIPFLYPDDGCYARAHEICRLVGPQAAGKTWIYGRLVVKTANKPNCVQTWVYHVAPFALVNNGNDTIPMVIDPSLFHAPVSVVTWRSVQGDKSAAYADSESEVWYRSPEGKVVTDPTFEQTNKALKKFRTLLQGRALKPGPPHPPYPNCKLIM